MNNWFEITIKLMSDGNLNPMFFLFLESFRDSQHGPSEISTNTSKPMKNTVEMILKASPKKSKVSAFIFQFRMISWKNFHSNLEKKP